MQAPQRRLFGMFDTLPLITLKFRNRNSNRLTCRTCYEKRSLNTLRLSYLPLGHVFIVAPMSLLEYYQVYCSILQD